MPMVMPSLSSATGLVGVPQLAFMDSR